MKYILNYTLIIIASLILAISIYQDNDIKEKAKKYQTTADKFFEDGVYDDAIINYKKSIEYIENIEINKKIIDSYLKNQNINEAIKEMENSKFDENYISKIQSEILEIYLAQNDYRNFNNYINKVNEKVRNEYLNRTFNQYIHTGRFYDDVKYSPNFNNFIVKKDDKWMIVNENGRNINLEKHQKILGIWNNYYTAFDDGYTKVYDISGNIKANLKGNYKNFYENFLIKEDKNGMYYVNRAGEKQSDIYTNLTNFSNGKALIFKDKWKLIDNKFQIIEEFDFTEIKIDEFNNAIFDDKIIFKDNKYTIYDIKNNKFSSKYDDIDFSYGGFIAVKNKKWGYIDQDFNKVIDFKYDEASSFTVDRGIVTLNKKLFIIDKNGSEFTLTNPTFQFNDKGVSFIKTNDGYELIKLLRYFND